MHQSPEELHTAPDSVPVLCNIGAYEAPRGQDFPPHHHDHWELVFYRRGFIEAPIEGEIYRTRPGLLLLTPPNTTHAERATTGYANIYAAFKVDAAHPWPRIVFDDAHGSLAHLFTTLLREYETKQNDSQELIQALTMQLDILLRRTVNQNHPKSAEIVVREVEILWEEAPEQSWRIESTARSLGVSPSQLRADFVAVRGQSPTEILRAIRVRHALSLLAHSQYSLEVVAEQSGFHSASHLSRHIKAHTGQAPGKWRK